MRTITFFETTSQKKTVVENVEATTLKDLKDIMDTKGINYVNMDFMEGFSKTELLKDDSILPSNIPWNNSTTNDLLILLTLSNKNIKSGLSLSRQECYSEIKGHDLQESVKDAFGKNFTQVSTAELNSFLESYFEDDVEDTEDIKEEPHLLTPEQLFNEAEIMLENITMRVGYITNLINRARNLLIEDKGASSKEINDVINSLL